MREFQGQQGWLTIVQNNSTTNYLHLATIQAKSIKYTQKVKNYAIITDQATSKLLRDEHYKLFDFIVVLDDDDSAAEQEWKLNNEPKVWHYTPWKETVKLDSDIIFPRSVDQWWEAWRQQEVCFATKVYTPYDVETHNTMNRKLFVENRLPQAYSGLTYFRYGQESMQFFANVGQVFANWPMYRDEILSKCYDKEATTDVAYAIAAVLLPLESKVYNPEMDCGFVHLKESALRLTESWERVLQWQVDSDARVTIDGFHQFRPLHVVSKNLTANSFLSAYERAINRLI